MTFAEAVRRVVVVEKVSPQEAERRVRAGIGNGAVRCRWLREEDEQPPTDLDFWRDASIEKSRVLYHAEAVYLSTDESGDHVEAVGPEWRDFVINRNDVEREWAMRPPAQDAQHGERSGERSHRPSDEDVRQILRKMTQTMEHLPNVIETTKLVLLHLPAGSWKQVRSILKEDEFASRRRHSGRPRKPDKKGGG